MLAEYRKRHENLWPEVKELLLQAGIRNYSIWNEGHDLFGYFESEDIAKSNAILSHSKVNADWDKYMEDIIEFEQDETGNPKPMELVFYYNG